MPRQSFPNDGDTTASWWHRCHVSVIERPDRREDNRPHHVEKNDAHNFSSCSLLLCTQLVERLERRADLLAVLGIRIHILKPVH